MVFGIMVYQYISMVYKSMVMNIHVYPSSFSNFQFKSLNFQFNEFNPFPHDISSQNTSHENSFYHKLACSPILHYLDHTTS